MSEKSNVPALPTDYVQRLMSGIAETRSTTIVAGGKPFFRLMKSGKFVFGPNNEEVQQGSQWVVNIMSMAHGYSCWSNNDDPKVTNQLLGEVMVPMTSPRPARPDPIGDTPYKDQCAFELKCITGDDTGTEVQYKINSVGGIRAAMGLLTPIYDQLASNPAYPCPVLVFSSETYPHKKYGEIAVPIFTIVGWTDMNGNRQGAAAPSLPSHQNPPAAPSRKRKEPLTVVPLATAPVAPAEPVPTAQTHIGQRRRPAAS